jgi:hypothetical protein
MFIAFFKKLAGTSLIALGCFVLGYWLWPSGVFEISLGELTLDKIARGALSLCFWVGGLRYLGNEVPGLEKQFSEIEDAEKLTEKIVIDCPYCTRRMRIPLGRRLQVKCPNSDCKKEFKYGDADGDVKRSFARSCGIILSAVLLGCGLIWIVNIAIEDREKSFPSAAGISAPARILETVGRPSTPKCKFRNPATSLLESEPISLSICDDWSKFWCLIDDEYGTPSASCRITIYLMSKDEKNRRIEPYAGQWIAQAALAGAAGRTTKTEVCQGLAVAEQACATAGSFERCVTIKLNRDYSEAKARCGR